MWAKYLPNGAPRLSDQRVLHSWWVGTIAGMASYIDAAAITAFSSTLIIFERLMNLSPGQVGAATSALTMTMAVGAWVGGSLGDRFGRRPVFVITMFGIIAGSACLMFATTFLSVLVGVAILGFAIGADLPVSLATISEAATDENRGRLLGFSNLLWLLGIAGNGILVAAFGDLGQTAIYIVFGHIILVALLVLAGRLTIPESPMWSKAQSLKESRPVDPGAPPSGFPELLKPPYLVPFIGLTVFLSFTNILGNTNGQYLQYMMVKEAGFTVASAAQYSVMALPLVLIGFLWFMKIADQPSRFSYFKFGAACYVLLPLVIAFFGMSKITLIPVFILNAIGASFAFEGIYRVWSQQSFPTLIRTTAQGAMTAIVRFTAAAAASITPLLMTAIGVRGLYGILAATTFIGVATAWAVFRTRDRQSEFDRETGSLHL